MGALREDAKYIYTRAIEAVLRMKPSGARSTGQTFRGA